MRHHQGLNWNYFMVCREKNFKTLQGVHNIENLYDCFFYLNISIEVAVKIEPKNFINNCLGLELKEKNSILDRT